MISSIFAWFKALPVAGRVFVALAPLILVALIYGAGYHSGWNAKAAKVAKVQAQEYRDLITENNRLRKEVNALETQGREHENQIRNIRVTFNPNSCKPTPDERVRFIERQARRDALAGVSRSVPGTLPPSEADERD